jgi:hypothetical protein
LESWLWAEPKARLKSGLKNSVNKGLNKLAQARRAGAMFLAMCKPGVVVHGAFMVRNFPGCFKNGKNKCPKMGYS